MKSQLSVLSALCREGSLEADKLLIVGLRPPSSSQLGAVLPPRGHLAMSENIFGFPALLGDRTGGTTDVLEAMYATKHSTV